MNDNRCGIVKPRFSFRNNKVSISAMHTFYAVTLILLVTPVAFGFPLTTEDTGTLVQGRSKIELNTERGEDQMNGARERSVSNEMALIHGLQDNLSGFLNLPYRGVSVQEADGSSKNSRGFGDARFGVKWRYFEQDGLSLGIKGGVTVPTGDSEKKLGNGQSTYGVNAIASYETAPLALHLNFGYTWLPNTLNQREGIINISTAVVLNLSSSWKVMADIGVAGNTNSASNEMPAFVGAGLSYKLKQALSLDLGVKHGITTAETDHTGLIGLGWVY